MKQTKINRAYVDRNFPAVDTDQAIRAAKDAAWFAAPGLSDEEHAEWVNRLMSGKGAGYDLPLGLFEDASRRFFRNLAAIESGIPNAIEHLQGIEA